jgi:hypothetical protein
MGLPKLRSLVIDKVPSFVDLTPWYRVWRSFWLAKFPPTTFIPNKAKSCLFWRGAAHQHPGQHGAGQPEVEMERGPLYGEFPIDEDDED